MSFTYDELKTAMQDYTENTETSFVANLAFVYTSCGRTYFKVGSVKLVSKKRFGQHVNRQ